MRSRSARRLGSTCWSAKLLPWTAVKAISRFARRPADACSIAQASSCTAARTSSRSLRRGSAAYCSAAPFSSTAACTTFRSALSSSAARPSARPSCSTAAKTTSRSARIAPDELMSAAKRFFRSDVGATFRSALSFSGLRAACLEVLGAFTWRLLATVTLTTLSAACAGAPAPRAPDTEKTRPTASGDPGSCRVRTSSGPCL
mmetsp:Transcript_11468/g.32469  ORF Transcript_11468/g.32469 Transcript_11468/m.32469 type:complete len:202 (-) Transcript_11468:445-1050(-)